MSRNELTLLCPKCHKVFLHTPVWASPVCPSCGYVRNGGKEESDKPKFRVYGK